MERWWLTINSDTELRIEHALDLGRCDLALFLIEDEEAPQGSLWSLAQLQNGDRRIPSTETRVSPEEVFRCLATLRRGKVLPRCFILRVRPEAGDNGTIDGVFDALIALLEEPTVEFWLAQAGTAAAAP